jgi:hypothetical protein
VLTLGCCLIASLVKAQTPSAKESNAALRYWMAFAMMQDPPADRTVADLLESVASGKAQWDESRLGSILDANRGAIQAMQRGSTLSDCDWGVEYDLGPTAPIAHLAKARVLARLNTLAGIRLRARGQLPQAFETWLAGVRFSQHVAEGGSLISLLTGRAALGSNLHAIDEAVRSASIGEAQRKRIDDVVRALPDTAFDWSEAIRREASAIEIAVQQLSRAPDPRTYYQTMMGEPAPANFSVPGASDLAAFRRFMARAADTLRLPPESVRRQLKDLEANEKALAAFFQRTIPSLARINDVRAELQAERQDLLQILAAQPKR